MDTRRHNAGAPRALPPAELRELVDRMDDILYRLDQDGGILWCNAAVGRVLGHDPEELIGRRIRELYPHRGAWRRFVNAVEAAGGVIRDFRIRYRRRDGSLVWLSIDAHYVYDDAGRIAALEGTARDISTQHEMERALRASEQRFRTLAETSGGIVFVYRERFLYTNPALSAVTGYSAEELREMPVHQLVHPDQREGVRRRIRDRLAGMAVPGRYDVRIVTRDGETRWLAVAAGVIEYEGAPAGVATGFDITKIKQAEQALREALANLEALAANANDGILVYQDDAVVFANRRLEALLDRPAGGILGLTIEALAHPDEAPRLRERQRRRQAGAPGLPRQYETCLRDAAGRPVPVEVTAAPTTWAGRPALLAIVRDIAARKRDEEELRRRLAQQAMVAELGQRALADVPLADLFQVAVVALRRPLGADLAELLLCQPGRDALRVQAASGWSPPLDLEIPVTPGGLAAFVLEQPEAVIIGDPERETRFTVPDRLREAGVRSSLTVVVRGVEGPLGLLCAHHTRNRRGFSRDDANFLQAVANVLAEASERDRRARQLEDRERQARIISEAMTTYLARGDWRAAAGRILAGALELTASGCGFLGVLADGRLRVLASQGMDWDNAEGRELYGQALQADRRHGYLEFAHLDNLFGRVLETGAPLVNNDPARDPRAAGPPPGHPPLEGFLGVPIRKGGDVLGMIAVANRPGGYQAEQAGQVVLLAETAAVLYEAHHQQAARDAMESERRAREARLRHQQDALLRLAKDPAVAAGDLQAAVLAATRIAGQTLKVGRASVWFYTPDRKAIECRALYEPASDSFGEAPPLSAERYPAYFGALADGRVVDAADARVDPRTREFAEDYLGPLGIGAMLDAPIRRGAQVVGVVCHEHLGGPRPWSADEINFAASVADTITLVLALHEAKQAERALRASEARYRLLVDNASDAIFVAQDGFIKFPNPRTMEMFGYSAEELGRVPYSRFIAPPYRELVAERHRRRLAGEPVPSVYDFEIVRKDGRRLWIEIHAMVIPWEDRPATLNVVRDVTEQKLAREALAEEKERAQVTLSSIADGVITTDAEGRVEYLNPVAEHLTGWPRALAAGRDLTAVLTLQNEHNRAPVANPAAEALRGWSRVTPAAHVLLVRADGKEFSVEYTASPIVRSDGNALGAVVVFRDVTEMRGLARQLSYQASHDALTGLINRREFENRLEYALESARTERKPHALCYLDLDQFKIVNDTCGHVAGDELLRQLAKHLQSEIRGVDTLARLGGDEFGILLEGCPLDKAVEIADHLRRRLKEFRFAWEDKVFEVGASIGLVPIGAETGGFMEVMRAADAACYVAKDRGRDRVYVYQPDDEELARRQGEMQWVTTLRQALDEDRLALYFQPIQALQPDAVAGVSGEVLVRLRGPDGQLVPPMAFIPAAERYQLMPLLDRWVVEHLFEALASLPEDARDTLRTVSVNLSGQSLSDPGFARAVNALLDATPVAPDRLCFEITETAAIASPADALAFMADIRGRGCRFALDDFGSGLSSFAYLKRLQVDALKIDGHFVCDILDDPVDLAMVESINHIGHVMGLTTIAECVENEAVIARLRELGVDYAQGFGVAAPVPLNQALTGA